MRLMFYKTDNFRIGSKGENSNYDLTVEAIIGKDL